jgi:putative hydroxymethylpyrimidine transporter CytX
MAAAETGARSLRAGVEAPLTLDLAPPKPLDLRDQVTLWGSLGVSLLIPVAAVFVLRPFGFPPLSLAAALTAVVVGALLGSLVLGLAAVPGARTGAPAMVLLRGLLGNKGSYVPTVLNILQLVGWASLEVLIIAEAAVRISGAREWRWAYVLLAGGLATLMAVRPLTVVRTLRRYAVWLVIAATAYLFFAVVRQGLPAFWDGSWAGYWAAMDVVVALPVSWAPLAADYARHSRSSGAAFAGAFLGYAVASAAYFALGLFALVTVVGPQTDPYSVVAALLAVPAGALALTILVVDEVDEAFANIYSTAMSAHNMLPRVDRRVLAVTIGVLAVLIALIVDVVAYETFLLLIGSVFVPLFAVAITDFFLVSRGMWDLSASAPIRWWPAVPWVLGFVTYQLVNPGAVTWWASMWSSVRDAVGFAPASWMSASLLSFGVAAVATLLLGRIIRSRAAPGG